MSTFTSDLMKQLRYISLASNEFMHRKKQRFTGQQRVLAILDKEDGLIQSHLAEILDIRPSSLAELLKKMENSGDITREEDATDKRLKRVSLTEQGRQKVVRNTDAKEDLSEAFFAGLTENEKNEFSEYLTKIAAGWDDKFRAESARFADPMDRLQQMQAFRQQMFDQDWEKLSKDEQRKLKKELREKMKEFRLFGDRDMREFGRQFGKEFGRDFHKGFHHHDGFFGGGRPDDNQPHHGHPFEPNQEDQGEWKDF